MRRILRACYAGRTAFKTKAPPEDRQDATAVAHLKDHLRRDIGIDDAHSRVRTTCCDPLEVEIRRLLSRL